MNHFVKIPSLVQIMMAEIFCLLFLVPLIGGLANKIRPGTFGAELDWDGSVSGWIFSGLGLALALWLLHEIFRPRIKSDSWFNPKTGSDSGGDYAFLSTHPSYVLVDGIAVVFAAVFVWITAAAGGENDNKFFLMLALALVFPFSRLLAWYGLGLRLKGEESRHAWKPVAWLSAFVYGVFGLIFVLFLFSLIQSRRELASAPVVDEQTFANSREAFAQLLDAAESEKVTRYVRLRARQISDAAMRCRSNQNRELASVLADLGAGGGGDVLIVGTDDATEDYKELVKKAEGNKGGMVEAVGRLRAMPPKNEIKAWKPYCGIDGLPPAPWGGRWVLEVGRP